MPAPQAISEKERARASRLSAGSKVQSTPIICGFHVCEFVYMLQLTCDPKSAVLHGHMQSSRESVTQDARSQLRWNKAMICFLVLAPAVNTGPFYGLFPDTLSTFLCFLMVDPLFTMVRSTVLKCHLLSTGMQLDECHSARATMPLAASSVSVSQQHTLKKVSLNRNTGKIRLVLIS